MCVLTKNKGEEPFIIITRTADMEKGKHALVRGPFRKEMEIEIGDFKDIWKKGAEFLEDINQGTRVQFITDNAMFQGTYPVATNLDTLSKALAEHLGVMYRHFLSHTEKNHIHIFWTDKLNNIKGEFSIKPIFPVFKEGEDTSGKPWYREDIITVENEKSENFSVIFKRGVVDWNATRVKYRRELDWDIVGDDGKNDTPFRIYYRKNQRTQGIDIVYMGRTLNTAEIETIWDDVTKHNRYNSFIGEIIILNKEFETVNNKIQINKSSTLWQDLKNKLKNDGFKPIAWGEKEKESSVKDKLKEKLKAESATREILREKGYNGVDIDLLQFFDEGFEYIYEVKRIKAKPLDVYQLVMYWDAYKKDKHQKLKRAFLVAPSISDNARVMLNDWNERKDATEEDYDLKFKKLSDYGLEES